MVVAYAIVGFIGTLITVAMLWRYGPLIAFSGGPFGGSLLVLVIAVLLALRPDDRGQR
jgi:hypothetical protein